ncbi:hypothetical protein PLICRDRAFT_50961 [Plicaturopsis crispa FD-325 SS-3]|nr:hypothetical protein PLICRDRAFT_50961 [Plicaturopsis crispa FD-325 SS-3]
MSSSSSVIQQQAIPAALFLLVPFFSVPVLYLVLSRPFPSNSHGYRKSRVWISCIAISFLGLLSTAVGALGIAAALVGDNEARNINLAVARDVLATLLTLTLGASVLYFIAVAIPGIMISPLKVLVHNAILGTVFVTAAVFTILSPVVGKTIPNILAPLLTLIAICIPLPVLFISLFLAIKSAYQGHRAASGSVEFFTSSAEKGKFKLGPALNRPRLKLWLLLLASESVGALSALFGLLQDNFQGGGETAALIMHSAFMIIWTSGVMMAFHTFLSYPAFSSAASQEEFIPPISQAHSVASRPHSSRSAQTTSDFLNLRDPFASPPPGSATLPSFLRDSVNEKYDVPSSPPRPSSSNPISHLQLAKRERKARKKASAQSARIRKTKSEPPKPASPEDADFGTEEALLAQMLLRTLDYEEQSALGQSLSANQSTVTLVGKSDGGHHPYHYRRNRFTQDSVGTEVAATLCEASPPPSPMAIKIKVERTETTHVMDFVPEK